VVLYYWVWFRILKHGQVINVAARLESCELFYGFRTGAHQCTAFKQKLGVGRVYETYFPWWCVGWCVQYQFHIFLCFSSPYIPFPPLFIFFHSFTYLPSQGAGIAQSVDRLANLCESRFRGVTIDGVWIGYWIY
jgi:hypothetical protein